MRFTFTRTSGNAKTGPIPVTMTERNSCPDNCALKGNGCYAESGMVRMHWQRVAEKGISQEQLFAHIQTLPRGQLWRHNVAGDLPSYNGGLIDPEFIDGIIQANNYRKGFTYTHNSVLNPSDSHNRAQIRKANNSGFTINLSANNLNEADQMKALNIGPVVCIMPENADKVTITPAGNVVTLCPATYREDIQCANCGICAKQRQDIIGFPVHGSGRRKANKVFMMTQNKE